MKVLFVLNAFGPASGAEHVLIDFLKTAPEIEPLFLHIGPVKPEINEFLQVASPEDCYYVEINTSIMSPLSRQWFMKPIRADLCRRIRSSKVFENLCKRVFELVYFNNSFEAASFYPLFENSKTIVHIHDMVDMFRPAQKKCALEACVKAGRVLTASEACRKMLIKNKIDPSRVATAYNSIALEKKDYARSDTEKITIGFVGSAIKRKGFDIYIAIINTLKKQDTFKGKKIEAVVITNSKKGDTFIEECLSTLDSDVECNVYYSIPRERVFAQYRTMDLLLVPSRFDPLPTVVLEASLEGVPVIGTNKDGIPEMQVDEDMLFNVDDVADAVRKIEKWFNLPFETRKEKMDKAQAYIECTFTAAKKKNVVLNSIREVLEM